MQFLSKATPLIKTTSLVLAPSALQHSIIGQSTQVHFIDITAGTNTTSTDQRLWQIYIMQTHTHITY